MPTKKSLFVAIPVLLSIIAIPQLLYYWLVPAGTLARLTAYCFGTVLTTASAIVAFSMYWLYGLRRSCGVVITAGILDFLMIAASAILIVCEATIRTTAFALSILGLVYLISLLPMAFSASKTVDEAAISVPAETDAGEKDEAYLKPVIERTPRMPERTGCIRRELHSSPTERPLPPRVH